MKTEIKQFFCENKGLPFSPFEDTVKSLSKLQMEENLINDPQWYHKTDPQTCKNILCIFCLRFCSSVVSTVNFSCVWNLLGI